ncbi:MAG: hypothetical protein ACTSUE_08385 [Promethearchaeota archaeon]
MDDSHVQKTIYDLMLGPDPNAPVPVAIPVKTKKSKRLSRKSPRKSNVTRHEVETSSSESESESESDSDSDSDSDYDSSDESETSPNNDISLEDMLGEHTWGMPLKVSTGGEYTNIPEPPIWTMLTDNAYYVNQSLKCSVARDITKLDNAIRSQSEDMEKLVQKCSVIDAHVAKIMQKCVTEMDLPPGADLSNLKLSTAHESELRNAVFLTKEKKSLDVMKKQFTNQISQLRRERQRAVNKFNDVSDSVRVDEVTEVFESLEDLDVGPQLKQLQKKSQKLNAKMVRSATKERDSNIRRGVIRSTLNEDLDENPEPDDTLTEITAMLSMALLSNSNSNSSTSKETTVTPDPIILLAPPSADVNINSTTREEEEEEGLAQIIT